MVFFCSRRICFCDLGFPSKLQNDKGKNDFLEEVFRIEEFIKDPWLLKAEANATVQVRVPKVAIVVPPPLLPPPIQVSASGSVGDGDVDEAALAISAQTKRAALQKKAAAASLVAEDYVRRFESGEVAVSFSPSFSLEIEFPFERFWTICMWNLYFGNFHLHFEYIIHVYDLCFFPPSCQFYLVYFGI